MEWPLSFTTRPGAGGVRFEISSAPVNTPSCKYAWGSIAGRLAVADVSGRSNIAGAGINIAQRVMDCGDAGHILVSKHMAEDLEQYGRWQQRLHDLGECEVKHGVRLDISNLYSDEVGSAQLPTKFQALKNIEAMSVGCKRQ